MDIGSDIYHFYQLCHVVEFYRNKCLVFLGSSGLLIGIVGSNQKVDLPRLTRCYSG